MTTLSQPALALVVFLGIEIGAFFLRRANVSRRFLHAAAVSVALFVGTRDLPFVAERPWLLTALEVAALFSSVLALYAVLDAFLLRRPWDLQRGPLPALVRGLVLTFLLITALLIAMKEFFGISPSTLVVSSTVLSAVLGLALQDVLKNVFAGMALQMEGVPQVGDWMRLDGQDARIIEMTWRSTTLQTNEGHRLIEPNSKISERKLINLGTGRRAVAFGYQISLGYEVPPAQAKEILLRAARGASLAAADPAPQAFLHSYGEFAVVYELRTFTQHPEAISAFRDQVLSRVWYELQRNGLQLPTPVRQVHLHDRERSRPEREQEQLERNTELLSHLELFAMLDREVLRRIAAGARKRYYDDLEVLFSEGEPGDSLFVIDRGRVTVSKYDPDDGDILRLAVLESGSFFGEMSLLTGAPRSATVQAEGGCDVVVLTRRDLQPVLAADPQIAEMLSKVLAERAAATAAALAEPRVHHESKTDDEISILSRIRDFFRLSI